LIRFVSCDDRDDRIVSSLQSMTYPSPPHSVTHIDRHCSIEQSEKKNTIKHMQRLFAAVTLHVHAFRTSAILHGKVATSVLL